MENLQKPNPVSQFEFLECRLIFMTITRSGLIEKLFIPAANIKLLQSPRIKTGKMYFFMVFYFFKLVKMAGITRLPIPVNYSILEKIIVNTRKISVPANHFSFHFKFSPQPPFR
jgi:hypothetical protein